MALTLALASAALAPTVPADTLTWGVAGIICMSLGAVGVALMSGPSPTR